LRSELKGYVENPEYYFQKGNEEAELAADLLMKTHGWTRYAIPDVIKGKLSYPKIPFEASQKFSGNVKSGLFAKTAKSSKVTLLSMNTGFYDLAEADENGRFVFENFEFQDNTKYIIQALNNKGKGKQVTDLYVDEETFPEIHANWVEPFVKEEKNDPVLLDYVAKADLQYTYENGMRVINLREIEVIGTYDKDKDKRRSSYYYEPDRSFSEKEIEKYGGADIKNLLYRVPGVTIRGNIIRIRNAGGPPLIVIDDMPMPMPPSISISQAGRQIDTGYNVDQMVEDYLKMVNINEIEQFDIIKDPAQTAAFGSRGSNGVIVIRTKRGREWSAPSLALYNIKVLTPLGYQPPVEFYSPKYDSPESIKNSKPDLRTTIFWKPNVVTDDEGNATLDFYTADDPATYTVIIEGISDDGKLIHYRGDASIMVK
jgi:TonB-dependent SusC/RagA subfamily outer membrane receptor